MTFDGLSDAGSYSVAYKAGDVTVVGSATIMINGNGGGASTSTSSSFSTSAGGMCLLFY